MLTTLLAVALMAPQAPPPTSGLMQDMPIVTMAEPGTGELMYSEVDMGPVALSAMNPDYAIAEIVDLPAGCRISSFSRGTGALFSKIDANDRVELYVGVGWGFLAFTVTGMAWDPGTIYAEEVAAGGSTKGDVFGYVVAGSEEFFPSAETGNVLKVREGGEIDLESLVDIDTYLPGEALSGDYAEEAEAELGDGEESFYFTLVADDPADYANIPLTWNVGTTESIQVPATIFRSTRHVNGNWVTEAHAKASDLNLDPATVIDALSVQDPNFVGAPYGQAGIRYLLSTTAEKLSEQLLVVGSWQFEPTSPVVHLTTPLTVPGGGLLVESGLGLSSNGHGISGTCGEDPGADLNPALVARHRLRTERMALTNGSRGGNARLSQSIHQKQEWLPLVSRYRATLTGLAAVGGTRARLKGVQGLRGGQPTLVEVRVTQGVNDDKYVADFEIDWLGLRSGEVLVQWEILNASGTVIDEGREMILHVR